MFIHCDTSPSRPFLTFHGRPLLVLVPRPVPPPLYQRHGVCHTNDAPDSAHGAVVLHLCGGEGGEERNLTTAGEADRVAVGALQAEEVPGGVDGGVLKAHRAGRVPVRGSCFRSGGDRGGHRGDRGGGHGGR